MRISEKRVRLLIDEKLFKDVFINMAQNALSAIREKYSDCTAARSGTQCPGLFAVETFVKDDAYIITISDNGIGMSEETASHIFEPYFTTKAKGTGLGMTIAYKIIKEFSGDIQVSSVAGEGTVFTITLPVPQTDRKLLGEHKTKRIEDDSAKIADKMAKK